MVAHMYCHHNEEIVTPNLAVNWTLRIKPRKAGYLER